MERSSPALGPSDALVLVGVQRDLLPGGAAPVPDGDAVIAPLNRYLAIWASQRLRVFAIRDWHPPDHRSFRARGGASQPHCVAGTPGAQLALGLDLPCDVDVVSKGVAPDVDGDSAFDETDFEERLRRAGIRRLFVGGLATEHGVRRTVEDALARGYEIVVLGDAVQPRDPAEGRRAEAEMARRGATIVRLETRAA